MINHETILAQAKKDLEMEKVEAVRQVSNNLQAANEIIKEKEQCIKAMKLEKMTLLKDYQHLQSKTDYMKNSEAMINSLNLENLRLKGELDARCKFINYRDSLVSFFSYTIYKKKIIYFLDEFNFLQTERDNLIRQLSDEQMKMSQETIETDEMKDSIKVSETKKVKLEKEMSASVSVVSDSSPARVDVATCTEEASSAIGTKHSSRDKKSSSRGKATLATCNRGDVVAMVWDPLHENYIILQDSETKYFLNSDSLAALGLKTGSRSDSPSWAFGEVVEKEFCKAKKVFFFFFKFFNLIHFLIFINFFIYFNKTI